MSIENISARQVLSSRGSRKSLLRPKCRQRLRQNNETRRNLTDAQRRGEIVTRIETPPPTGAAASSKPPSAVASQTPSHERWLPVARDQAEKRFWYEPLL